MSEIRTSGPLLFSEPNNPTRVGEIINSLNEIYDIPMPRLGMSVYVKDEGVNYTITKLEPKLIEGVLVPDAKVAEYELQTGKSIAWNSSSNVNDYVVAGVYNITGERLNADDGLPIANSNPGHTISARLVVLDSSIKGAGDSQDKCITQVLTLSNRTGEDGNMYIRTGHGGNINSLSWGAWATLQTNINVGFVDNLDNLKDNGIYSGVWTKGSYNAYPLTFVCIVINDYFIGTAPRKISQFVYGLSKFDGSIVYQTRVWDDSKNAWGDWEILNKDAISSMISNEIKKVTDGVDPEKLDSLKDLIAWVDTHGGEVAGIKSDIQANEAAIEAEIERAMWAEGELIDAIQANANNLAETKRDIANQLIVTPAADKVAITGRNEQSMRINFEGDIPAATTEKAGVMTAADRKKLNNLAVEGVDTDLNNYVSGGTYFFDSKKLTNVPILNDSIVSARLTVLRAYDGSSLVINQVLNLNNLLGGEGNVYIRSNLNGTWKPWGKLQTNVEVGQITPDGMSNLIDNGIYSGVCVDGATVETFVLIVINNYLAATQAGFGSYISQMKYAIDLNRGNTVKTRTRDAYGIWNDWSEIGGYVLPEATETTLGGVKLGTIKDDSYTPLVNITPSGVGIKIDSSVLRNLHVGLSIRHNDTLTKERKELSVRLGTIYEYHDIIPCVLGTLSGGESLGSSVWNRHSVGILYNQEQFCLKDNGLNLVDGIASGVTKVTWDANSNMNNYTTAGIYDIKGTRESLNDHLPIVNLGENATIAARLIVTVTPEGATTYRHSVGQTLILSNAEGKETKVYTRNGNRTSTDGGVSYTITWGDWKCLQGMVEYGIVTDEDGWDITASPTANAPGFGMHGFIENGMYSGIYTDDYTLQSPTFIETFVLVVINDYAVSSQAGTPRRISQLKYATDTLTGQCTVKKRVGTGGDSISWGDWEDIGGGGVAANKSDKLEDYFPDLSNLQDGIYEFYGTLPNDDNEGTVWRYIFDDMGYHSNKCVYCKLVININLPDPESGNMFVFGNGKAASILFNVFTREVTTANIL